MGKLAKRILANCGQSNPVQGTEQQALDRIAKSMRTIQEHALDFMNRRIPNGTYGGGRGRGLAAPSYSIFLDNVINMHHPLYCYSYHPHMLLFLALCGACISHRCAFIFF
jgi:hypothetical protein